MKPLLILSSFFLILNYQSEWTTYEEDEFQIKHPSSWQVIENEYIEGNYTWNSPLENKLDAFSENVNLLIQDFNGLGIDLATYTQISSAQIQSIMDASILKSERVTEGDDVYQVIHYTASRTNVKLYFVQHYRILNDKAYVLTFTAEQDKFGDQRDIGFGILESFKIK